MALRQATEAEFNRIVSIPNVVKGDTTYWGNPRGRHSQSIVYCYSSCEVAAKIRKFRGRAAEATEYMVNQLFIAHAPDVAYQHHLKQTT